MKNINPRAILAIAEVTLIGWLLGGQHAALVALAIIMGVVLVITLADSVEPPKRRGP